MWSRRVMAVSRRRQRRLVVVHVVVVARQRAMQVLRRPVRVDPRMNCGGGEGGAFIERQQSIFINHTWTQLTLHIVSMRRPSASPANTDGNAHDAGAHDEQPADGDQDEPGQV